MRYPLFLAALLFAVPASAQPTGPVLPLNTAASAVFTHSGQGTDGYRLYIDGQKVGDYSPDVVLANGEVRLPIPPQPTAGRHVAVASAFNAIGETRSTEAPFFVGAPPVPGPLRIEIIVKAAAVVEPQPDGSFKLRVDGVDASAVVK